MKQKVVLAAKKKILFLSHAIKQMSRPDRMITAEEIKNVVHYGTVIETYPDDPRGESCLMLYVNKKRAIHVVCAPKKDYLAIITAYIPDPKQWSSDFKVRK